MPRPPAERQLHVYQVQNRPVAELAGVLQSMFSNEMKVVKPPTRNVSPRSRQVGLGEHGESRQVRAA